MSPPTWKLQVWGSFSFGGCLGGSYSDTGTNTFLGILTGRRASQSLARLPPGFPPLRRSWRSPRSPHTGPRSCLWTPARQCLEGDTRGAPSWLLRALLSQRKLGMNERGCSGTLRPQGTSSDAERLCWPWERHCNFICVCIPKFFTFLHLKTKRKGNK